MNAVINNREFPSDQPFKKVMDSFFINNSPEKVKYLFWKLLQCYVLKDCNTKVEVSDKDVALFYDQLMDLVTAAYILHQANRVSNQELGGNERE